MTREEKYEVIGKMVYERKEYNQQLICRNKQVDDIKSKLNDIMSAIDGYHEYSSKDDTLAFSVKGKTAAVNYPTVEEIKSILDGRKEAKENFDKLDKQLKEYGV